MNVFKKEYLEMSIYPNCYYTKRTIEAGGFSKDELLQKLNKNEIKMNEYGKKLFADDRFTLSEQPYFLRTIELIVRNLDFPEGATTVQIFDKAKDLNLKLCPLELAPYFRLAMVDQKESHVENFSKRKQAPSGSITIASEFLTADEDFPKGFYIQRLNDTLWLRGYIADDLHVWNPEDHFLFIECI